MISEFAAVKAKKKRIQYLKYLKIIIFGSVFSIFLWYLIDTFVIWWLMTYNFSNVYLSCCIKIIFYVYLIFFVYIMLILTVFEGRHYRYPHRVSPMLATPWFTSLKLTIYLMYYLLIFIMYSKVYRITVTHDPFNRNLKHYLYLKPLR